MMGLLFFVTGWVAERRFLRNAQAGTIGAARVWGWICVSSCLGIALLTTLLAVLVDFWHIFVAGIFLLIAINMYWQGIRLLPKA